MIITTLFKNGQLVERLHCLIRRKATGTTEQLAEKLCVSDRTVERYIRELKDFGFPIDYCPQRGSYYYAADCEFTPPKVTILDKADSEKFKGGKKLPFFNIFFLSDNFCR
jgi:biotin operon repressor